MLELVDGGLLSTGLPRLVLTDRHFHNNEIFGAELEEHVELVWVEYYLNVCQ